MQFAGVLQPLLDSVRRHPRTRGGLVGQEVALENPDVAALICLDNDDNAHLLLSPSAQDPARFQRINLRGLSVANHDWSVAGREPASYLDLSCATGAFPGFLHPFLSFCEDLLADMEAGGHRPEEAVQRAWLRWRRFWSPSSDTVFTIEWLYGLAGEIIFLRELVKRYGTDAVRTWVGPEGRDHDFQTGSVLAAEVKTSATLPYTIQCNLNQLDPSIFERLYLVCFLVNAIPEGDTLPDLVAATESLLRTDEEQLDLFFDRLAKARYRRDLESQYREHSFAMGTPAIYLVNDDFPKLTMRSFNTPPDGRITTIRYTVEITGISALSLDRVSNDFAMFGHGADKAER